VREMRETQAGIAERFTLEPGNLSERSSDVRDSTDRLGLSTKIRIEDTRYTLFTLTTVPGTTSNTTKLDNSGNSEPENGVRWAS